MVIALPLFFLLIIIYILSLDVNIYFENSDYTTKLYAKVLFKSFNIPYQRIMDKYKVEKTVNERINDFIKIINYHNYLFYLFRYSVINELHLVKYDDLSYSEINIYENTIIFNSFYFISSFVNQTFKSVYNESYRICYKEDRRNQIDGYLHFKTNVFAIILSFIVYFIKKRRKS